jgi:hypothetical protein
MTQHRHREMCFSDAGRTNQAEPVTWHRKICGKPAGLLYRRQQFFVRVSDEGIEIATTIPRWNPRFREETRRQAFAPAIASHDTTDAIRFYGFPASVVAEIAGHEEG